MITVTPAAAHAMLDALRVTLDSGTAPAIMRVYAGTVPTSINTTLLTTNILLAELALSKPSAPAAADGKLTLSAITDDAKANATGTATFFRIGLDTTTPLLQGSVSVASGTGDLKLDKIEITIDTPVRVNSAVFEF